MSQPPPAKASIASLNLDPSEKIELYKELIRILERDIDEIKEGGTPKTGGRVGRS